MAVANQTPYKEYIGNGTTTIFPLEFDCDDADHLIVKVNNVDVPALNNWSLNTNTGSVVFAIAPTNESKIILQRDTPLVRDTDYQTYNNSLRPQPVNNDFDKIWLKLQELGVTNWLTDSDIKNLNVYVNSLNEETRDDFFNKLGNLEQNTNAMLEEAIKNGAVSALAITTVNSTNDLNTIEKWDGRTVYVKDVANFKYDLSSDAWILASSKANSLIDSSGLNQQEINTSNKEQINLLTTKTNDILRWVTPQMFGAKGDGITDDSDAFAACVLYVTLTAFIPTVGSNRIIGTGIRVPATNKGYRVAQSRRFIPNLGTTRYVGLVFEGDGLVRIHFDFNDDDYMCYNNNQFLQVKFRNIDFSCYSDTSKFLYSTAAGGAQDYSFDNCNWNGRWNKLYVLRGENNNSEWSWLKCGITCTIRDVMLDIADSDQFLNYWFYGCKLWLYDGQCVRASAGGHIKFIYCDWSGLQGTREQCTSVNGKYLFELTGNVHARGVCDFRIIGGRFECKINSANNGINARLLYCEWNQGNIELSYDASSTIINEFDSEYSVHIKSGNTAGPILSIHDSYIIGKLKFETNTAAYGNRHLHSIRDTTFGTNTGLSKPSDFIDIIKPSLNVTGAAAIKLSNCRCSSADKIWNATTRTSIPFDATLGSRYSLSAAGIINSAEFKGSANGNNPISNQDCFLQLPINSTILSIKITCDGLGTTTTASTWVVSDSASGTALLTCASHRLNERWSEKTEIPFFSATGLLKLVDSVAAGQTQAISGFRAVVEYVC